MEVKPPRPSPSPVGAWKGEREPGLRLPARLGLLFMASGLVPLGISMLVLAPRAVDSLRTSSKLLHESQLDALRVRIEGSFDALAKDVHWLGSQPQPDRSSPLRFLLSRHPDVTCVTLYDGTRKLPGGQAFDRALVTPEGLARHEHEGESLAAAGAAQLGAAYAAPGARGLRVTWSAPFSAAGPQGRLVAEVGLGRVQEAVAAARVGRRGQAFLVDTAGKLVAHRDPARALAREDLFAQPMVAELVGNMAHAAATGRPLVVVKDVASGRDAKVSASVPLTALGWGLVTEEPRADAYGAAEAHFMYALGWAALAVALLCFVALYLARNITRPVALLVEGTGELARGAFGLKVEVHGPPEVRELMRVFNEASTQLARYDKENRELLREVERGYLETLRAMVNAIEAKDPYTAGHSQRTAEIATMIARHMHLTDAQLMEIEFGGLLHDIGKIGIPEQILRKPAALDDAEMTIMKGHANIGGQMTQGVPFLERVSGIIRNHHERWDGSGYPDGLRADAIPIGARIVAVADTWDAVTSDRPYQQGRSPAEALVILQRLSGTTLDTDVVRALELSLAELGVLTNDTTATPAASPAEDPRGDDRPARSRTN